MDYGNIDAHRLRRQVLDRLEVLAAAGVTHLGRLPPVTTAAATTASAAAGIATIERPTPSTPRSALSAPSSDLPAPNSQLATPHSALPTPHSSSAVSLEVIRLEVTGCTRCRELASMRTQTVFGVGNPQARLCFIGEAPGADEDRQGEPFVGKAGQLLTKIIEACRMKREDVYILNVLKCRPPENRPPLPDEVANCRGYLERQLEILKPEFICCLGATAAQTLLGSGLSIGKLRGRFHSYEGATVICTYHPSYLLRNPAAKRDVWEDMKLLLRKMGVELET